MSNPKTKEKNKNKQTSMTLFRSITMFCGTDNILWIIQTEREEYST